MRKSSGRKLARRIQRVREASDRSRGDNPRVRWTGRNLEELRVFVVAHGGSLTTVGISGRRPLLVVQPVMMSIHPGRWIERVVIFEAGDERGWKTYVV